MRLLPFGRKKSRDPIDEVQEARERAMLYLRERRGLPPIDETVQVVPENLLPASVNDAETPVVRVEAGDSLVKDAVAPHFLLKNPPEDESPETIVVDEQPAEAQPASPAPADDGGLAGLADAGGGDDLLSLFSDAKEEMGDKSLASEVEDLSISDLLGEIKGIGARLGVKPRKPIIHTVKLQDPEPEEEAPEEPLEEEIHAEQIDLKLDEAEIPPEIPLAEVEVDESAIASLLQEEPAPPLTNNPAPIPAEPAVHRGSRMAPPKDGASRGGGATGPLLHLLFLGLLLGGAIFSFNKVHLPQGGSAVAAAAPSQTPAVLAVFRSPSATPTPAPKRGTKAPTATPSPSPSPTPSPTPTPEPTPRVRDSSIPFPFYTYYVEYGDSLMSIAMEHGVCPDYLLWNNDRDEETPLKIGDAFIIPDYPGVIHVVEPGDTLEWIALLYSSTVGAITSVAGNQVQSNADLVIGEQLLVPGGIPQSAIEVDSEAKWAMTVPSDYGYVWPFWGPLTTYYGEVRESGYVHNAIDIGGLGHYGSSVVSIAAGTVIFAGEDYEFGQHMIVEHADGSRSLYAHLSWEYVAQGDWVERGQALGGLGCTGASTGTHLHFELWRSGIPVDPLLYFN